MLECYQNSARLKEFCDESFHFGYTTGSTNTDLLSCYQKFKGADNSNINDQQIQELSNKIECEQKKTAQELFDCLGKPTDTIDFCYYLYKIEESNIDQCVKDKAKP